VSTVHMKSGQVCLCMNCVNIDPQTAVSVLCMFIVGFHLLSLTYCICMYICSVDDRINNLSIYSCPVL
jgi:hypothetical protein